MKKQITALLLSMLLMLTACSAADNSNVNNENISDKAADLILLTNPTPYFAMGENGGYMTANSIEYGYDFYGELIFRVDEEDKSMQILCNKTDCVHDTEQCPAFLTGSQGGYSIVCHNGKIYSFVGGNSNNAKIYSIDENTLEKKLIKEFATGYFIYTYRPVFLMDNGIYYLANYINRDDEDKYYNAIVRLDTVTEDTEMIYTTEMYICEMGIDNGSMVFTANMPEEQYPKMYYLDLQTGQVTENVNYDCRYETLWPTVNGIISYDESNSVIYRYTNGEKKQVSALVGDKVGYAGMYLRGVYKNMMVIDCFKTAVISPGNYEVITTKFAINLDSGHINELQMKYQAGGLTEEVPIMGIMKDGFVVKCGEEYTQVMVEGQDHVYRPMDRTFTKLAYITAEDFFNNRQNYIYLN